MVKSLRPGADEMVRRFLVDRETQGLGRRLVRKGAHFDTMVFRRYSRSGINALFALQIDGGYFTRGRSFRCVGF